MSTQQLDFLPALWPSSLAVFLASCAQRSAPGRPRRTPRTASTSPDTRLTGMFLTPSPRSGCCSAPSASTTSSSSGPSSSCCSPTANSCSTGSFPQLSLRPAAGRPLPSDSCSSSISSRCWPWSRRPGRHSPPSSFRPPTWRRNYIKARSSRGFLILGFIALLMLAYFGLHGAEIALGERAAAACHAGLRARRRPASAASSRPRLHGVAGLSPGGSMPSFCSLFIDLAAPQQAHAYPHRHPQLLSSQPRNSRTPSRAKSLPTGRRYGVEPVDRLHLEGSVRLLFLHRVRPLPGRLPGHAPPASR